MEITLKLGDCIKVLKTIPDNSIDSIVTDPPYGIGFMGKAWDTFEPDNVKKAVETNTESFKKNIDLKQDNPNLKGRKNSPIGSSSTFAGTYDLSNKGKNDYQQWCYEWGKECLRILKPGGHLLASNSPRMYHRMAIGLEDAGFEIRDQIMWVYGSGFPKSLNIGKTMDKFVKTGNASWNGTGDSSNGALGFTKLQHKQGYRPDDYSNRHTNKEDITEELALQWEGWGTALKPAHEPIVLARKPLSEKSIVENVLKHGTGGINIDGSRIGTEDTRSKASLTALGQNSGWNNHNNKEVIAGSECGRFPANIIFDDSGNEEWRRYFYCPKTSKKDRNEGLDNLPDIEWRREAPANPNRENRPFIPTKNNHPTVKPTDLMRYLINLVTPKGGTTLDPFMGSGSTGKAAVQCGVNFIGIEKEEEYMKIAEARINHEKNKPVQQKLL